MSEKYGEPWRWICAYSEHDSHKNGCPKGCDNFDAGRINLVDADGETILREWAQYADDAGLVIEPKDRDRIVLCVNACANRSESDIAAAFALWDNREKVVEKLEGATGAINIAAQISAPTPKLAGEHLADAVGRITAALSLLQAEKEGKL